MNSYEKEKEKDINICNTISTHFTLDTHLKQTKKNIVAFCFSDILTKLCFTSKNNDIIIDYRYFKFIAVQENYNSIIKYIVHIINKVLETSSDFYFHVNLSSLTLLHIEKYFAFIRQISETMKTTFPDKLNKCYIYNAPFIFSNLFNTISIFIDKKTQKKIQMIKNE